MQPFWVVATRLEPPTTATRTSLYLVDCVLFYLFWAAGPENCENIQVLVGRQYFAILANFCHCPIPKPLSCLGDKVIAAIWVYDTHTYTDTHTDSRGSYMCFWKIFSASGRHKYRRRSAFVVLFRQAKSRSTSQRQAAHACTGKKSYFL